MNIFDCHVKEALDIRKPLLYVIYRLFNGKVVPNKMFLSVEKLTDNIEIYSNEVTKRVKLDEIRKLIRKLRELSKELRKYTEKLPKLSGNLGELNKKSHQQYKKR